MIQFPQINIYPYWELVKRRKWWLIIPFMLVSILGTLYIAAAPKVYKASTLILVESQRVPSRYIKSTISQDLRSRLHTITQQIKSRSYLKDVINRYELIHESEPVKNDFLDALTEYIKNIPFVSEGSASERQESNERSMYSMVKLLRDKIDVSLHGRRNSAFEVSFEWNNPNVAAEVANALASQFIEQNLNLRSEMAMGTTDFLSLQVQQLRNKLKKKEQELENFRNKHMGKLPGQMESNLNILNQLKNEKNSLEERIDRENQQLMLLRNRLDNESRSMQMNEDNDSSDETSDIASLQKQLKRLRSQFTDHHPDVIDLKNRIQKMKNDQDVEKNTSIASNSDKYNNQELQNKPMNALQKEITQTESRIKRYREHISDIQAKIQKYQERLEQTPKIEMQLKDLQRNYDTVKKRYENLLSKKLDAEMAEELEKRQKGEQFKVIDSAIPPRTPFQPDVQKLGFLTLVLGLGIGGGLSYLRECLDPAFYSAEDAERQLGNKVLVDLPWEDS